MFASKMDFAKKPRRGTGVWVVLTALLAVNSYCIALPLSTDDDWEASIRGAFEGGSQDVNILEALNRVDRSVRLDYFQRQTFSIDGEIGAASLEEKGYNLRFTWPYVSKRHRLLMQFETSSAEPSVAIESSTGSGNSLSRLTLKDHHSLDHLMLAHNWRIFQISWGVDLRWVCRNGQKRLEPAFDIGWGDLSDARLRFRISSSRQDQDWYWIRAGEAFAGSLSYDVEEKLLDLAFGDPFGVQMSLQAGQESWRNLTQEEVDEQFTLGLEGSRQCISMGAKYEPLRKLGWRVGGTHNSFSGEAKLTKRAFEPIAQSQNIAWHSDVWGGGLTLPVNLNGSLEAAGHYLGAAGNATGWLKADSLPAPFAASFLGETIFAVEGSVDGGYLTFGWQQRTSLAAFSLQIGLVELGIKGRTLDLWTSADENQIPREVVFPLRRLSAGWGTLTASVGWRNVSLGGTISQAYILDYRTTGETVFGENAKPNGGWLGRVWMGVSM